MANKPIIEACVESIVQAILAQTWRADRIELCSNLAVGGLTPSNALLQEVLNAIEIPVMAMVRPRKGDFCYSKNELDEMKKTISYFKKTGIKGVVFGFLKKDNEIDIQVTEQMADFAFPLEVTFHKAIDETSNPINSIKALNKIKNITRVLTSGGSTTAINGKETLIKMNEATSEGLTLIAAGSVTKENIEELHASLNFKEYHGRRIVF